MVGELLCFVDLNFTLPAINSSLPYDVGYRVSNYSAYAIVSECTASDRQSFMRQLEAGLAGSSGYPGVSFRLADAACAQVPA